MQRQNEERIDQLFYALSDQSRRKMLLRLTKTSQTVTELGEPFGMTKQAISKHLKVLEIAGLITKEKDGRIQRCLFNPKALEAVQKVVQQYRDFWEFQLGALEDYIEQAKKTEN
jgi:DNA-binding transcriptional ArsR family regulator